MPKIDLAHITTFEDLRDYLRDELHWPLGDEPFSELTFEYEADELGIDPANAATIRNIYQLRPLEIGQPWGIFFVDFEKRHLPVVALRRILRSLVLKKRGGAEGRRGWDAHDLLFITSYGDDEHRHISFAHFCDDPVQGGLPTLRVLGWDGDDTKLKRDYIHATLREHFDLRSGIQARDAWRERWASAFTIAHKEPIRTAKDLASRLAVLAFGIRQKALEALRIETKNGPLRQRMAEFKKALIHDLDDEQFADMYAQTVAYGLLSARVSRQSGALVSEDLQLVIPNTNPFLREMLDDFLRLGGRQRPGKQRTAIDFDELGVSDVVETLRRAKMDAVLRDFGDKNPQEDPVIHFYEDFLDEYDPEQKKRRGVFYTPRPVVSFIVRSVHELLQTEFGLADGLADTTTWGEMVKRHKGLKIPEGVSPDQDFVQILDPATGTGTFLVEVIDVIHDTLDDKWRAQGYSDKQIQALWNEYVPKHLLPRLHGYELMMAPYAIAHLKLGLKLGETGYDFSSDERARVYLTNALEPATDSKQLSLVGVLPALAHEALAVNKIKTNQRFTVVVGNPPYLGEAGRGGDWIAGLMRGHESKTDRKVLSYFQVDGAPLGERNPKWLNDLYVRFTRLSQWLIERTGVGVHGFITNHSYCDNPTFRGMRWALLATFERMVVVDLHGNVKKKEATPNGGKDENVFDIEQGVAIGIFLKRIGLPGAARVATEVEHVDCWGVRDAKYAWLGARSAASVAGVRIAPQPDLYLLKPMDSTGSDEYASWIPIPQMFPVNSVGIVTARDSLSIHWTKHDVWSVVNDVAQRDAEDIRRDYDLGVDVRDWRVRWAQEDLRRRGPSQKDIVPILYRPFDRRFTYWSGQSRGFLCYPRAEVMGHMLAGRTIGLITCRQRSVQDVWAQALCTMSPIESTSISNKTKEINYIFPLWLEPEWPQKERRANVASKSLSELVLSTGLSCLSDVSQADWDGRGDLRKTFGPRDVFDYVYAVLHSADYRLRYADFLKSDFARVPLTPPKDLFRSLSKIGGELTALHLLESPRVEKPISRHVGRRPAEVEKVSWSDDTVWIDKAKTTGFKGVREEVWNFHIGGYQVCEKWLKDRKGRTLSEDDITHYNKVVVALSETIRLMAEIDEVIDAHGGWPAAFQPAPSIC